MDTGEQQIKKITVRITKKLTHYYHAEKKIFIPIQNIDNSQYKDIQNPYFTFRIQMVLPSLPISPDPYVKKIIQFLEPSKFVDTIIHLKKDFPEQTFQKVLKNAQYSLIKTASECIIGSDDDPVRVYEFLSKILNRTSKIMEENSRNFMQELIKELYKKGINLEK